MTRIAVACLALLHAVPGRAADAPVGARPNIVVIIADDLGYGELGCQGNAQVPTPNIDSLARNGVRFTSGYVTAPYCAPSRAGFLTGRNQARFGYDINPVGRQNLNANVALPATEVTMADRLQRAGYATALVGKWHLGGTAAFHPQQRGFHEFYGFLHEGHYYAPTARTGVSSFLRTKDLPPGASARRTDRNVTWSGHLQSNEPAYDDENPVLRGRARAEETEFLTDAWAREATDFIHRHREKPFFLQLAYNAPHSPMQALDAYIARFAHIEDLHRRIFAAMVAHLDESVGRVLAVLREESLDERTLIFFFSDNGGPTKELTSSNAPLAGGKGTLLEGGIRVPFLMKWKGRLPAGKVYEQPVSSLDVLPTALAAAGVSVTANPGGSTLDGVNLLPFLTGERTTAPHEMLFWRFKQMNAIRRGDWKLLRQTADGGYRLYNLASDIGETRDVAAENPEIARELQTALEQWLAPCPLQSLNEHFACDWPQPPPCKPDFPLFPMAQIVIVQSL